MLKKVSINIVLLILLILPVFTLASDNRNTIRVGISSNDFSQYTYQSVEVSSNGIFEIIDATTGEIVPDIPAGNIIKIQMQPDGYYTVLQKSDVIKTNFEGPVIVRPKTNCLLTINGLKRAGATAYYRGFFELVKKEGQNKFCVVNILDLENYLKGVVPNEMPIKFGLEALKAQTVAARNYALKPREKPYKEYDICDSVACQVYFGAGTEKELATTAIKQTNGIVALDNNDDLILALYSSTAGGYTESYANAFSEYMSKKFPSDTIPYLRAKPDNPETPILDNEEAVRSFYSSCPQTYDNASPYFRWKKEWTLPELENILKQSMIEQSTTGFIKPQLTKANVSQFGKLKDIRVIQRGNSGKIVHLNVITDTNSYIISKELVIRRTFKKDGKALPSANFFIDKIQDTNNVTKIIFQGGGFGHGVGLSQYGAGAMAQQGYTYDKILQHYYTGIKLATYPVVLQNISGKNTYDQVFYTSYPKADLCIENKSGVEKLIVIINGKEIELNFSLFTNKNQRIPIDGFILNEQNTIVYYIPDTLQTKRKDIKVYVEIKEADIYE